MTEREINLIGFQQEYINEYEGDDTYYYVYDIVDGLTLITHTNIEVKNDDWFVEIFNTDPIIRFHKMEEVQSLINKLTNAIVRNEK